MPVRTMSNRSANRNLNGSRSHSPNTDRTDQNNRPFADEYVATSAETQLTANHKSGSRPSCLRSAARINARSEPQEAQYTIVWLIANPRTRFGNCWADDSAEQITHPSRRRDSRLASPVRRTIL